MSKVSEVDIKLDNALFADIEKAEIEKSEAFKRVIKAESERTTALEKVTNAEKNAAKLEQELIHQRDVEALLRKENEKAIATLTSKNSELLKEIKEIYNSKIKLDLELQLSLLQSAPGSIVKKVTSALFYSRVQKREISTALQIAQSGLFDAYWYVTEYPDVAASMMNPILHYMRYGVADKRNPSENFNSCWYLSTYLAEEENSVNPLVHYIEVGISKGYKVS